MAAITTRGLHRLVCHINSGIHHRSIQQLCSVTNTASEKSHEDSNQQSTKSSDDIKLQILETALSQHVHQHGWTLKCLQEAATSLGMPSVVHGLFPSGGFDLVSHFYRSCNAKLASALEEESRHPLDAFIRRALQTRLNMITPHIDTWPQAMAQQALPQHALTSLGNLAALSDEVWHLAGDTSTDFSWYTKRLEVGLIYKSSELFMLQDRSPSFADTWSFMDRRLENIQSSGAKISALLSAGTSGRELLTALGMIAKNVTRT